MNKKKKKEKMNTEMEKRIEKRVMKKIKKNTYNSNKNPSSHKYVITKAHDKREKVVGKGVGGKKTVKKKQKK